MARLAVFGIACTGLATAVVSSAFVQYKHFYPASLFLWKSSTSFMAIMNFGLFLILLLGRFILRLTFGSLRPTEVEHLYERSWLTITEILLAMTIFRNEFDTKFLVLFAALLFTKVFHWISTDRVNYMEQSPVAQLGVHIRLSAFMVLLLAVDVAWVLHAISVTIGQVEPSSMILFGFEYMLLASSIFVALVKYIFHLIDMRREEPWENKSVWIFYLEMGHDFFKLVNYIFFLVMILTYFKLPIHIMRDLILTLRSFLMKVRDLVRYQQATRNMDERYPDATSQDLERLTDRACIICREDMQPAPPRRAHVPKVLPCGHIFHFTCLRSWLERQQSCPTCRSSVLGWDSATLARRRAAQAGGGAAPQPVPRSLSSNERHGTLPRRRTEARGSERPAQGTGSRSAHPDATADGTATGSPRASGSSSSARGVQRSQRRSATAASSASPSSRKALEEVVRRYNAMASGSTTSRSPGPSSMQPGGIHMPSLLPYGFAMPPPPPPPPPPVLPPVSSLTDGQLKAFLEPVASRAALEEQLKALHVVQIQIAGAISMLSQIVSATTPSLSRTAAAPSGTGTGTGSGGRPSSSGVGSQSTTVVVERPHESGAASGRESSVRQERGRGSCSSAHNGEQPLSGSPCPGTGAQGSGDEHGEVMKRECEEDTAGTSGQRVTEEGPVTVSQGRDL